MTLFVTFILGFFFLAGALIARVFGEREAIKHISLALGFGALATVAAVDLVPEVLGIFRGRGCLWPLLFIILGMAVLFILDMILIDAPSKGEEDKDIVRIGIASSLAIVFHNMIEGMTVYGVTLDSFASGLSLALGIGLHNIPMGIMIYITVKGKSRVKKTIVLAMVFLSTFAGGVVMSLVSGYMSEIAMGYMIALTIGMIIYLLGKEIGPYLWKCGRPLVSLCWIGAGAVLILIAVTI